MNIFEKMLAITSELQTVAKNLTVQQSKISSYKAVAERDILDAVKPLESKYGVYSYPHTRNVLESNILDSESHINGQTVKKTIYMTRISTVYRFVNIERPDEYIDITSFAEGIDSQDKGSGKAMTYADKYALMKAYKISTGEDPDQEAIYTPRKNTAYIAHTPREMLIMKLKELGIDINAYAKEKGITAQTTAETFGQLLKELG